MITKDDLRNMSDRELLDLINQATEQHCTGKNFSEKFDCDFSYTHLTQMLRNRGWTLGWHKLSETVDSPVQASGHNCPSTGTALSKLVDTLWSYDGTQLSRKRVNYISPSIEDILNDAVNQFPNVKDNIVKAALIETALREYLNKQQ